MAEVVSLDGFTIFLFILRWFHFIFGVTWIGLLYFFNYVNGPFAKTMDAETKKKVVPQLMPRALWWFRWSAMITFLTGWFYVFAKLHLNGSAAMETLTGTTWGQWISLGSLLGSIMWFNVWFIIWPSQQKLIRWVKNGESPAEATGITKKAFTASRLNTYLSVPMLFCMGAASHLPAFNLPLVLFAFGFGIVLVWHLANKVALKAGANF